ncbi:alpha/beta hydrolase [Aureisphaera galaxeae]|uniref:alpha/beta fold hydrolase n=1 Tax=Aureisphaera galaxeae TaxID=1538023 RepID=UPI002350A102|nr:alpha/beta hydrolase [Aureisphaera galaxeae]MDC8002622.1 alpha/beta hydrolase [Aureisphaera galaxeae]
MIYHYNEVPIFYEQTGTGPAIVLLHGFLESSTMWEEIVSALSGKYTFIYIDLPGHGKSGVIDEVHTMELMANVVYQLLNHLNLKNASFVGHSMGGYIALALAEKHTTLINHLVLLNSTTFADSADRKKQRDRALRFIEADKDTIVSMAISNLFYPEVRNTYASEIKKLKEEALQFPTEGIMAAIRGMKDRKDRTDVFKNFPGEKTIVCGSKDPVVPLSVSKEMAKATGVTLKILDGSHMSWIENRSEIVKIVHFIE